MHTISRIYKYQGNTPEGDPVRDSQMDREHVLCTLWPSRFVHVELQRCSPHLSVVIDKSYNRYKGLGIFNVPTNIQVGISCTLNLR